LWRKPATHLITCSQTHPTACKAYDAGSLIGGS
jgi:hypothetical protein